MKFEIRYINKMDGIIRCRISLVGRLINDPVTIFTSPQTSAHIHDNFQVCIDGGFDFTIVNGVDIDAVRSKVSELIELAKEKIKHRRDSELSNRVFVEI